MLIRSLFILTLSLFVKVTLAQDLTLFDQNGDPIAYIDTQDEDLTIYLMNGKATAYLSLSDTLYHVYGFNGLHLGWFGNGILRDNDGFMVGCLENACFVIPKPEPFYRPFKQLKPFKSFPDLAPFQPIFYDLFSKISLYDYLLNGIR